MLGRRNRVLMALAVFVLNTAPALAGSYYFRFDQPTYLISPGGQVTVGLYLGQTTGTALTTEGLSSSGVLLRVDVGSPFVQVTDRAHIVGNPSFNAPDLPPPLSNPVRYPFDLDPDGYPPTSDPTITNRLAGFSQSVNSGTDPVKVTVGNELFLGTITLTQLPPVAAGETLTLQARNFGGSFMTNAGSSGAIDSEIDPGTAILTVVPTPPSIVLLGIGAVGLVWRRRSPAKVKDAEVRSRAFSLLTSPTGRCKLV